MVRIISNNDNNNMEAEEVIDFDDSESSKDDQLGEEGRRVRMRKGPWTTQEDSILIEYVNKYGEGNWNSVQRNSGLLRCGKSCRLRWANHLRPNLKKGAFSEEEEHIIIDLHAKLGNKWAQMAAQLPGRTDNEIKNFWNTRMKRRQRAGLPLYPPQVLIQNESSNAYQPLLSSSSDHSFSMLLASCYPKKLIHEPTQYNSSAPNIPPCNFTNNNNPLLSPISPNYGSSSSSSSNLYNPFFSNSSQLLSPPHGSASTPEYSSSHDHASGVNEILLLSSPKGNSGLLDALVAESKGLSSRNKRKSAAVEECGDDDNDDKEEGLSKKNINGENAGNVETQSVADLSSSQLSKGKKVDGKEAMEEMNSMDDDLYSLLNNFPSETPTPEWYRRGDHSQQSYSLGLEKTQAPPAPTDQEFAWTLGTCWNNVTRIC